MGEINKDARHIQRGKPCPKCGKDDWRHRYRKRPDLGGNARWAGWECLSCKLGDSAPRQKLLGSLWRARVSPAKSNAKRRSIPFNITKNDVVSPSVCPILRSPLGYDLGRGSLPSIDRLVPSLGYIPGNVYVISLRANRLKSDGTASEHLAIANWMNQKMPELAKALNVDNFLKL